MGKTASTQLIFHLLLLPRYAHVNPECLEASPTNTWWHEWQSSGASKEHAQAVLEQNADYDGLAVVWGIGHTTQTAEDCAEACRSYSPTLQQGGECSQYFDSACSCTNAVLFWLEVSCTMHLYFLCRQTACCCSTGLMCQCCLMLQVRFLVCRAMFSHGARSRHVLSQMSIPTRLETAGSNFQRVH